MLHYCSLTLAHAKGPSQKESTLPTLPTIHFERTVLIFRGAWHDDILAVAGLAIPIRRNGQQVEGCADCRIPAIKVWQLPRPSTQLALCVQHFREKKTSYFTGCMSCNITVRSVIHLVQCFCKVPNKVMILLIERTFGDIKGLTSSCSSNLLDLNMLKHLRNNTLAWCETRKNGHSITNFRSKSKLYQTPSKAFFDRQKPISFFME